MKNINILSQNDINKIIRKREDTLLREIDTLKERVRKLEIKLQEGKMLVR